MNFKKAFTLVEIIIVLIIIFLIFSVLGYISWSYVNKLNLENDKESLEGSFSYMLSRSLSQSTYKNHILNYVWLKLSSNWQNIVYVWFKSKLDQDNLQLLKNRLLNYTKVWKKFDIYSWDSLIDSFSGDAYFVFKSYELGASFIKSKPGIWEVFTWNKYIKFSLYKNNLYKKCFEFRLSSGRLFITDCQ